MVLLVSISTSEDGRCFGKTEDEQDVQIRSVPIPRASAVYLGKINEELGNLRTLARNDASRYYFIQDLHRVMAGRTDNIQTYAIGYIEFIR